MSVDMKRVMDYAWMSQAAYLDLVQVTNKDELIKELQSKSFNEDNKFAERQAKALTDDALGYQLVSHLPNTNNGTSLTVFKSNTDGSYTIAVRGTEPWKQGGADLFEDAFGVVAADFPPRVVCSFTASASASPCGYSISGRVF